MNNASVYLAIGLVFAGCTADRFANPNYTGCTTNEECGTDQRCVSGFCVASGGMDAGHDGGRDAGPGDAGRDAAGDDAGRDGGTDAGPLCPVDDVCYDGEESTRMQGVCMPGCRETADGGGTDGGSVCVGQVLPGDEECNDSDDDCDGTVDEGFAPFDTVEHCGACDAACATGETCCDTIDLSGVECANTSSSFFHCGGCRQACDPGEACCAGGCAMVATDRNNCGACGNVCVAGQDCCDGRCVDTSSSLMHCNACGNACTVAGEVCCPGMEAGNPIDCRPESECLSCSPVCMGGRTCCGGACLDAQTDGANCGSCGNACAAGEMCCGGVCTPPDDACGSCTNDCSASEQCCGGSCVSRMSTSTCGTCETMCAGGEACCASGCADTDTDSANCGTCGNECIGQICSNGNCCDAGRIWCDGPGCIVPNNNANCGACGRTCPGGLSTCNCAAVGGGHACRNGLGAACG